MKLEVTRLTEAQQCEIIAKFSKPNVPSKQAMFDDTNNEEYCVVMLEDADEVLETMRIEEEPAIDDEIEHAEKFVESLSVAVFKGFKALHNIVLDIDD